MLENIRILARCLCHHLRNLVLLFRRAGLKNLLPFILSILGLLAFPWKVSGAPMLVPICQIQGSNFNSSYQGQVVRTRGVVTADLDERSEKGFFIQAENCDGDSATSDGIFVYLGGQYNLVSPGDLVEVTGMVQEYYGLTEINAVPADVLPLSLGQPLPPAVELHPPFDNDQARGYFEALESMLVSVSAAQVVGPTDGRADTWVVRSDLGLQRVFQDDPAGTGEVICVGAEGPYKIEPPAKVGDQIQGLEGVLDFSLGTYRVLLLTEPALVPARSSLRGTVKTMDAGFVFGTLNLNNLFDTIDDPATGDDVLTGTEYHRKLEKLALALHNELGEPAFLAVQEVENDIVLDHLLARPEIEAAYETVWLDGPDQRGIDVALLYRPDQVTVLGFEARQGCTPLVDGLGPDGNRDMQDPQNAITCDVNNDGLLDGNRLYSRPPLLAQLEVDLGNGEMLPLWVMVNHWKSKREDTDFQAYTLPRRLQQAQFVAALSAEISASHPGSGLIVLGDLNDYPDSAPLAVLAQAGLWNALNTVDRSERYTYIYAGISQVLDQVLVNPALALHRVEALPLHINVDYPYAYRVQDGTAYRGSDHDPILVHFTFLSHWAYLPAVRR